MIGIVFVHDHRTIVWAEKYKMTSPNRYWLKTSVVDPDVGGVEENARVKAIG